LQYVPVFWSAECLPILLNFSQHFNLKRFEERVYLRARMKRHLWLRCLAIVLTKQLTGKHSSRIERRDNGCPQCRKVLWPAEGQTEARIDEVHRWQMQLLKPSNARL